MVRETAEVDQKYYQVAPPGSFAERMVSRARDNIYRDFMRLTRPDETSTVLDVGVSDVVGEAANVLERKYPHRHRITAVGLGTATAFQQAFPEITYRRIEPGERLPFDDASFDIVTSNAVLEHVGSAEAQAGLVAEMARVGRQAFISVPHRLFPVEHHTAIPLLHWLDATFRPACAMLGKQEWADPANLILMTRRRLRRLVPAQAQVRIGLTGIQLGPLSSNIYMHVRQAGAV
jgi:SAM-dependent methyltransferase